MKNLLFALLLISAPFAAFSQQFVAEETPKTYYYEIQVQDIGSWSDDASVKIIQTTLKNAFDRIVPMSSDGSFETSTSFIVSEEKIEDILTNAGFVLQSFSRDTKLITNKL